MHVSGSALQVSVLPEPKTHREMFTKIVTFLLMFKKKVEFFLRKFTCCGERLTANGNVTLDLSKQENQITKITSVLPFMKKFE